MQLVPFRTNTLLLAGVLSALALAVPAQAHDDGLTCHSHPTAVNDRLWIFSGALDNVADIEHSFENRLAADSSAFSAADVSAVRRGISELKEMVDIVYLLTARAERMQDPLAAADAQELARSVFEELPLAGHADFDAFLAENRVAGGVVLSIETLGAFLEAEYQVTPALVHVVERAAGDC